MPQIYRGFNINNTVIGRGYRVKGSELYWTGADGSKVCLLRLSELVSSHLIYLYIFIYI
jgi:hypothetical protein